MHNFFTPPSPSFSPIVLIFPTRDFSLYIFFKNLKEESKVKPPYQRSAPDVPACCYDLLPREEIAKVKSEVADTVDSVEGKRPGRDELEGALSGDGEGGERGDERGALEVPAEVGSDEVGGRKDVESAAEAAAGKALPDGAAEPGLLLVVDVEVGGDGAGESLLVEGGAGLLGRDLLGRDLSGLGGGQGFSEAGGEDGVGLGGDAAQSRCSCSLSKHCGVICSGQQRVHPVNSGLVCGGC